MTSHRVQKQRKDIIAFLKSPESPPIPEGVDRLKFGKIALDNYKNRLLEEQSQLAYNEFYGPASKPISDNYDLGTF